MKVIHIHSTPFHMFALAQAETIEEAFGNAAVLTVDHLNESITVRTVDATVNYHFNHSSNYLNNCEELSERIYNVFDIELLPLE